MCSIYRTGQRIEISGRDDIEPFVRVRTDRDGHAVAEFMRSSALRNRAPHISDHYTIGVDQLNRALRGLKADPDEAHREEQGHEYTRALAALERPNPHAGEKPVRLYFRAGLMPA